MEARRREQVETVVAVGLIACVLAVSFWFFIGALWSIFVGGAILAAEGSDPGAQAWWVATALLPAGAVAVGGRLGLPRRGLALAQLALLPAAAVLLIWATPEAPPALDAARWQLVHPDLAFIVVAGMELWLVAAQLLFRSDGSFTRRITWCAVATVGVAELVLLPVVFAATLAPPDDHVVLPLPPRTELAALHAQVESWDDPAREPATRSITFAGDDATTSQLVEHYRSLGWDLQRDRLGWCAVSGPYSLAITGRTATFTRFHGPPMDCSDP